ncbi:MAG: hypothetical protein M0003_16680, partial [Acidithiobacillus sp.]|nr:hypothetical protein [Acidithiobacillus sp.]
MLADEKRFGPLVAALRSALDAYRDRIKAVFTGSSQDGLRLMFQKEKAPLYQFSQQLPFPALERAFVEHLLATYTHITKWKLDADRAWQAFEELDRVPLYFRSLMERLVLSASTDIPQALAQIQFMRSVPKSVITVVRDRVVLWSFIVASLTLHWSTAQSHTRVATPQSTPPCASMATSNHPHSQFLTLCCWYPPERRANLSATERMRLSPGMTRSRGML